MSILVEESGRDIRSGGERPASERDTLRLRESEAGRRRAEADASTLRQKLVFLAERDRKRFAEIRRWTERLTRERAALDADRRRLRIEVEDLREEKRRLLARLTTCPPREPARAPGGIGERRILDFLTRGGREVTARTGA